MPPIPVLRVDWANDGAFTGPLDLVHPLDDPKMSFSRGRSGDFTTDATGTFTFTLDNVDNAYSPDRNWHDNPSFEVDTSGWTSAAVAGFTSAATSITQVVDNAPSAGVAAGEVTLPAVAGAGVAYPIPYRFRAGLVHSITVYLKSVSGSTAVEAGIGATAVDPSDDLAHGMPEAGGYPVDEATGAGTISAGWVQYAFTWTPTADRTLTYFFLRSTTAAAATFRVDAVQVNPGATANAYVEAPTKGQLVPGRPVHLYAVHSGLNWPLFYGFIERITPDLQARKVTFTAYDVLRRLSEVDVVVPAMSVVSRSARDYRREVLEDFERGVRNLVLNPEFAIDLRDWRVTITATPRLVTDDGPPVSSGSTCVEVTTSTTTARLIGLVSLVPMFFASQVYRVSFYLRASSPIDVMIGASTAAGAVEFTTTVSVTSDWRRYTVTWSVPATVAARDAQAPTIFLQTPTSPGTVRVGAVSVTRGQALFPYAATGIGRLPNWCGNGSFEGGTNGWYNGFSNYCTNPDFETNTAGWSVAADAFHNAATSITQTSGGTVGNFSGFVSMLAINSGAHFALVGTFLAGVSYRVSMSVKAGTAVTWEIGIGSSGTPTDKASVSVNLGTTWSDNLGPTWTPTADRTDAHVYVKATGTFAGMWIDAVDVVEADPARTRVASDALIMLPFATRGSVNATLSSTARYGSNSLSFTTLPLAGSGRLYAFDHLGGTFRAGQPYTLSLWLRASSAMPYRVGLAAATSFARTAWDSVSTSGSIPAGQWTRIVLTWTPASNAPSPTFFAETFQEIIGIEQTDAIARTVFVDGVRVIPGVLPDEFELPWWDIPPAAEPEVYGTTSSLSGSALSVLQTINAMSLSRHWVVADMQPPYWRYRVQDRDSYARAGSAERFGDVQALSTPELDRQSISNTVKVTGQATDYISDENSVSRLGQRQARDIGGGTLSESVGDMATAAAALNQRYRDPIRRPVISVENRWPSQLQRDVNDMVWVTIDPWLIRSLFGSIARLTTTVDQAGQHWTTDYQLEESTMPDGAYGSLALALPE